MKFLKKHKLLSFAVISFFVLSGVNFYLIFEFIRVVRWVNWDRVFFTLYNKMLLCYTCSSKNVRYQVRISRRHNYADERYSKRNS